MGNAVTTISPSNAAVKSIATGEVHILAGTSKPLKDSKQWAKIGVAPMHNFRVVAQDMDYPNVYMLLGVQGSGKSTTKQILMESALVDIPNITKVDSKPCVIDLHYTPNRRFGPESIQMTIGNPHADQVDKLKGMWRSDVAAAKDVVLLCPSRQVERRKAEAPPNVTVMPCKIGIKELSFDDWQIFMGVSGQESAYLQVLNIILERHLDEGTLTFEAVRSDLEQSRLSQTDKDLALIRLAFMERFVDNESTIGSVVKPGRMVIVDLRDPTIIKTSAFRLIIVLLRLFSEASLANGKSCPKLITLDEFHVYAQDEVLVAELDRYVRMMRHDCTSIILASQDPMMVKPALLELASVFAIHKLSSSRQLTYLSQFNDALADLKVSDTKSLEPGQAYWWTRHNSDSVLATKPYLIYLRPPATKPGGSTKTVSTQV
jgi:hypothetical protein